MTSGLEQLRNVMNTLRSPGGCQWDAKQTHETLIKYLIEETYELVDAIESGSSQDMREELGDVLLQVFFHSRIAEEDAFNPFSIDDVAREVAEKLVRRHPHIFLDAKNEHVKENVEATWQSVKAAEKDRSHVLDGVPTSMPAITHFLKILTRLQNASIPFENPKPDSEDDHVGWILYHVAELHKTSPDADMELRIRVKELRDRLS